MGNLLVVDIRGATLVGHPWYIDAREASLGVFDHSVPCPCAVLFQLDWLRQGEQGSVETNIRYAGNCENLCCCAEPYLSERERHRKEKKRFGKKKKGGGEKKKKKKKKKK